jgi:hypothetical protein
MPEAKSVSDSLIPISDEQAKLGQEALKSLRGLGAFIATALGSTPEDFIGYFGGDFLRARRAENMARLLSEARVRLTERGVEDPQPASLSVALPILRGAADEDRDELVDLWARLLANAMDRRLNSVRHSFIEAVKAMDPPDARTMNYLYRERIQALRIGGGGDKTNTSFEYIAQQLGIRQDDVDVSVRHLEALGFLSTTDTQVNTWFPNAKMREFMRACYPELEAIV